MKSQSSRTNSKKKNFSGIHSISGSVVAGANIHELSNTSLFSNKIPNLSEIMNLKGFKELNPLFKEVISDLHRAATFLQSKYHDLQKTYMLLKSSITFSQKSHLMKEKMIAKINEENRVLEVKNATIKKQFHKKLFSKSMFKGNQEDKKERDQSHFHSPNKSVRIKKKNVNVNKLITIGLNNGASDTQSRILATFSQRSSFMHRKSNLSNQLTRRESISVMNKPRASQYLLAQNMKETREMAAEAGIFERQQLDENSLSSLIFKKLKMESIQNLQSREQFPIDAINHLLMNNYNYLYLRGVCESSKSFREYIADLDGYKANKLFESISTLLVA